MTAESLKNGVVPDTSEQEKGEVSQIENGSPTADGKGTYYERDGLRTEGKQLIRLKSTAFDTDFLRRRWSTS
jgi:hypothetical protein